MEVEAEAMENAFVEGKILWLAQIILESTSNGKLAEWIRLRHAGLGEGVEKLTSEVERIETVVAAAKGRATGNKPLARSLARLKELLYDADDLVDDLDYFKLQEQVEGGSAIACVNDPEDTNGGGDGAEQVEGSRANPDLQSKKRKNRSPLWDHFIEMRDANGKRERAKCKYCPADEGVISCRGTDGTSGLKKHFNSKECQRNHQEHAQPPNPASAMHAAANDTTDVTRDSFRGKRMRIDEASTHSTASNTCPWDKDKFPNTIHQIVSELQGLREEVCDFLKDSVACSDQCQSNTVTDTQIRTSSFAPRKVYGRDDEKEYIIRMITAAKSDSITVLPIVGIVGVGKTALAQLVYNDPAVKSEFERIWVWVSESFDEVRLTREMLDVVCDEGSPHNKERHERIGNYSKLQEILQENMGCRSKRFLLVLDDVSDRMENTLWKQLLAPLESSDKKGNVIVITTRNLSVARRLGTVQPRKLFALEKYAFWLLFKACAFGDENYEGDPSLTIIGRQIAAKLKGNPLAAESAGKLLNEHLTIDHWSSFLKSEDWKSMRLDKNIMHALKLSYDKLPYNLQQCFLYCSIFPNNYKFIAEDLVFAWIAQGFMRPINSNKSPEDIGRDYLNWLVDMCFYEHDETKESTLGNQLCYVMCGIVHDFARLISGTECAAMDGIECNQLLPTTRHLSILSDSAYQRWNLCRNLQFEEKLQGVVTSATKLRTLVLIGEYDSFFFQSFADIFQKATHLRMLRISATYADFNSFLSILVNSAHLRYLKLENRSSIEESHIPTLRKFYHLQVLDVGHPAITSRMNGLVRMRHLDVKKGAHVTDQHSTCFEILQSMNDLVQLGVYQLGNVSRGEAEGAKLRDKQHLETLHLSWKDALLQDGCHSHSSSENHQYYNSNSSPEDYGNMSSVNNSNSSPEDYGNISSENHINPSPGDYGNTSFEHYTDTEPEEENWPMNGVNNILTSEQLTDTAKEVLEGLEPHQNLKHLRISGYIGTTSPNWFSRIVLFTCLQTLRLEDCGEWQAIPSLERLPLLTKLKLRNMSKVTKVSIPPLEELVLIKMRKLERCSCNSMRDLNSSLRVLMIASCDVLKAFPIFESCEKLRIEHKSWLSRLSKLTIRDCPLLTVSNPLPPSSSTCDFSISRVSTLPTMHGLSNGRLMIRAFVDYEPFIDKDSSKLRKLDDKILAFHNLRLLTRLIILGCKNLSYVSFEGLRQLVSLESLTIIDSVEFFSSDVLPEHAHEDIETANFYAFPTLKDLCIINSNKLSGKWLSEMLRHMPVLEELQLWWCNEISGLVIEGKESCLSDHNSSPRASSLGNPDDASTSSAREGHLHIPSNLVTSLKKMWFRFCKALSFLEKKTSFSGFTSLEELEIEGCPKLILSFGPKDENSDHANGGRLHPHSPGEPGIVQLESLQKLQLCPRMSLNCLKKLKISDNKDLESLKLDSYTALEELIIVDLVSLAELEGLQSLRGLRYLKVDGCPCLPSLDAMQGLQSLRGLKYLEVKSCPRLPPFLERLSGQVGELFPRLERLWVDDYSFLTTSFCMHLTSLQRLELRTEKQKVEGLTREQGEALELLTREQGEALERLTSLQDLEFNRCRELVNLPVCLHSLSSLKKLGIICCEHVLRLPEKGLPPSLEELEIKSCSKELTNECRMLATTSMLKVKIDWLYVN